MIVVNVFSVISHKGGLEIIVDNHGLLNSCPNRILVTREKLGVTIIIR